MLTVFKDLDIGTCFVCKHGKFKKLKNGADKFNGNAIGVNFPRKANIQGATLCKIVDD